jgi:RNA polymerase sigma-70 factor (ECF subfamily)
MATFEGVIETFGPGLARLAASYEFDRALREDLLQEILLAIHQALPTLREESQIGPFVFRIAHNRAVTHVARRASERRAAATFEAGTMDEAGAAESQEDKLLADEHTQRLLWAVRRLPLAYRQVITLVLEDLSYADIAKALGLSVSNVGVRVNRAKVILKELMDER